MAIVPVAVGALILGLTTGDGCSSVTGTVEAHGKPFGDYLVTPKICHSGEHQQFFGAVLFADDDAPGTLILADDPVRGQVVKAMIDGSCKAAENDSHLCSYVMLDPSRCARFELSIAPTSTTVNDIRLVDGHLKLNCELAEGGWIRADLAFESCD